jgi:hypothetical protein
MVVWHAHLDTDALATGSRVSVLSDHDRVRVKTADQMWIESPDGQRTVVLVIDRSGKRMVLSAYDGASYQMSALVGPTTVDPGKPYSHEVWLVN